MNTCQYCGKTHSDSLPSVCDSCLREYNKATQSHFVGTISEYFGTATTLYYIGLSFDAERKTLNWAIHNGANIIKRGFKTRKAAREYCTKNGMEYSK